MKSLRNGPYHGDYDRASGHGALSSATNRLEAAMSELDACAARIWHGPGHQSSTRCRLTGPHEIHEAVYGSMRQFAEWRGDEVSSGFFDEPPQGED